MNLLNIFKGSDYIGDGTENTTLTTYLDKVFNSSETEVIKFFYQQLYRDFAPDISGYTLVFFVPPDLSGYRVSVRSALYDQVDPSSYMSVVGKIMTFAAVDFTPPQSQVRAENVSTRAGSIPIASEVSESETISITFVDNNFLDIYMFHHIWVEYIREILEGTIEPSPEYYTENKIGLYGIDNYGAIDYAASCYIVKYRPDMKTVTYVSKCVGIFPQSLPNKELIGTRSTNEIVILPFTYSCSGFRESVYHEKSSGMWLFTELDEMLGKFTTKIGGFNKAPVFGGFLNTLVSGISKLS